ncbi:MAG TPA: hypothetical protein VJZ71_11345 [Phycisphaerae bacterium]|nr:hypothetical protein [Phycisphaerae bacterium]
MRAVNSALITITIVVLSARPAHGWPTPLPSNINNFFLRGTQPNSLTDNILLASNCVSCHGSTAIIHPQWTGSLMAQAARDPLFYACLDIAEADSPGSGDMCIRCHVPKAWLEGRSMPTNGINITAQDRDGITCNFCHRMVDPFNLDGQAPAEDADILYALGANAPIQSADLGMPSNPGNGGNGSYVIDPLDRRRGPFPLPPIFGDPPVPPEADCEIYHESFESPLHRRSDMCATCHDVSNPHFHFDTGSDAFVFNGTGAPHPNGNKYDMAPVERTYSEWLKSSFAQGMGVDMGGRFGGPGQSFVSDCQNCHMPVTDDYGCRFVDGPRDDLPTHRFAGASTWQLDAIAQQYGPAGTNEINASVVSALATAKANNISFLQLAADLEAVLTDVNTPGIEQLRVRVVNQTGHKLPSGYPEGRRMWINVQFFNCLDDVTPFDERGEYDSLTAVLNPIDTKVYEMEGGIDTALAAMLGRTAGPAMHFVLTNKVFKDNRIPPRGFTNAAFAAVQASPVAYAYADGQYWDDTYFDIPAYATGAKIVLYYQATSKEYIEFLRDNNPFPGNPNNRGQVAYNLWAANGKSAPVAMATLGDPVRLDVELKGDVTGDRQVTVADIPDFVAVLLGLDTDPYHICAADMDETGIPDGLDVQPFVQALVP